MKLNSGAQAGYLTFGYSRRTCRVWVETCRCSHCGHLLALPQEIHVLPYISGSAVFIFIYGKRFEDAHIVRSFWFVTARMGQTNLSLATVFLILAKLSSNSAVARSFQCLGSPVVVRVRVVQPDSFSKHCSIRKRMGQPYLSG